MAALVAVLGCFRHYTALWYNQDRQGRMLLAVLAALAVLAVLTFARTREGQMRIHLCQRSAG